MEVQVTPLEILGHSLVVLESRMRVSAVTAICNPPPPFFFSCIERRSGLLKYDLLPDSETMFRTASVSSPVSPSGNATATTGSNEVGSPEMSFEVIASTRLEIQSPGSSLSFPLHLISVPENPEFFGRESVMTSIDEAFFADNSTGDLTQTRTFAICGTGGVGKTQVATAYAHSRKDRFDAIFWIHASSSLKLRDEFGRLAITLGLVDRDSSDARQQAITRDLVKGWLANPRRTQDNLSPSVSWLLVFDNVDDPQVLEGFLPLGAPGCVLFTSRDPHAKHSAFLATAGVDIQPFSEQESSQLLERLTNKTGHSSAIHERLGGLPLAITQMASVIIRQELSLAEFIESYDEEIKTHSSELLRTRFPSLTQSNDYKETLWSVWAFQALKHSRGLLDVLSMLDPDGIPEAILTHHGRGIILLNNFPSTLNAYFRARAELVHSSLITREEGSKQLVVHRLVQVAARAKMDPERFGAVFLTALNIISSAWQFEEFGWRHTVGRWELCEVLMPHVLQLKHLGEYLRVETENPESSYKLAKLLTDAAW